MAATAFDTSGLEAEDPAEPLAAPCRWCRFVTGVLLGMPLWTLIGWIAYAVRA